VDALPTKWLHVNHGSGVDQGKSAGYRPTSYPLSHAANVQDSQTVSASKMTCILSDGASNYTHSLTRSQILLVASCHVTTCMSHHESHDTSWRDVSCMLCRACSNMTDDEEAQVLACKTISCLLLFIT